MRKVVIVKDYSVTSDDPYDWISVPPSEPLELVVISHYHYYRVGMSEVRQDTPAGALEKYFGYLPEGDNSEGSAIVVSTAEIVDEATIRVNVDTKQTKFGDNFILYITTIGKPTKDYRWPDWPAHAGTPRSFQIHLHIGPSLDDYASTFKR